MSYKNQIDVAEQLIRKTCVPVLPTVVTQLQTLFAQNETPSATKIKELLIVNPILTAEIVALANIPALTNSPHIKIKDIDSAILRLGTKYLKNYVMAISVKELLNTSKIVGLSYHSQVIANISMEIARYNKFIRPDEAYLLGLIHDIGAFILAEIDDNYGATFVGKQTNHFGLEQDEEARFGTTHSAIGYVLTHSWNLPNYISQTLLLHHSPSLDKVENDKLKNMIALIELAHAMAIKHKHGKQETKLNDDICKLSQNILGLSDDDITEIHKKI